MNPELQCFISADIAKSVAFTWSNTIPFSFLPKELVVVVS